MTDPRPPRVEPAPPSPERDDRSASATVTLRARLGDGAPALECELTDAAGVVLVQASATLAPPPSALGGTPARSAAGRADKFAPLLAAARALDPVPTAVVHPCSEAALGAAVEAARSGLIVPVLVGPRGRIEALAASVGVDLDGIRIVDAPHSHAAAVAAVALARSGEVAMLMKGSLHTNELLEAVVARDIGLRTERRLSHVFVLDVPSYHKLLLVTDAAINIFPALEEKRDICQNAIDLARALGVARPKVAVVSAVETINPKIPSTTDAAALCKMADRDQITGGTVDGPLAMDNAISAEAARIKGIRSPVAGDPDVLLVPDMEAGNLLAKQLTFMAGAEAAGVVVGARVPIVLTSRADGVRARLASCAVATMAAQARRVVAPKPGA